MDLEACWIVWMKLRSFQIFVFLVFDLPVFLMEILGLYSSQNVKTLK